MKTTSFPFTLIILLTCISIKGFAQAVPHDWPFIDSELTHRIDSTQMLIKAQSSGGHFCTDFAGSLTLASTNRGYYLWTPHPPGIPGVVDVAWQNKLLGQIDTELMMMDTLGYKAIDMDVEYPTLIDTFPNSQLYMSFEKKVFAMAKSMGFKTIVNCHTFIPGEHYAVRDLDSFYYRPNGTPDTMNTQSYLATKLQMLQTVIDSLAPDYLTLLEEPQAEYANLYGLITLSADSSMHYVNHWLSHLNKRNTLLGAGAGTWDVPKFFEDFAGTNIDYLDYHIYPIAGTNLKPMVLKVDSIAKANSKPLVIGECWAHKCTDSDWAAKPSIGYWKDTFFIGDDFSYFEHIDTLFIQTMIDLSQQANIGLVDFYPTEDQFGYLTYGPAYYGMNGSAVENIHDSIAYATMYKGQLGPLGVFTKNAVGKINAICTAGCTLEVTANILTNVSCNEGSNGSVLAIPSGGTSPFTYAWFNGGTNATYNGLTAGTYTVTITDNTGCNATASAIITQPNILNVSANTTANVSCNGDNSGIALVNVNGGTAPYTYSWSDANSQNTPTASNLSAGAYTVTVTDNCTNLSTASVTITEPAAISVIRDSTADNGTGNGIAVVTVSGGTAPYTYLWTTENQTTDTIKGQYAGNYCCTITDNNGCSNTTCITIKSTAGIGGIVSNTEQISVFPNPSNGIFTIQSSVVSNQLSVEIYNVLGEDVYSAQLSTLNSQFTIDLSNQPDGVYLYRLFSNYSQLAKQGKLIIER